MLMERSLGWMGGFFEAGGPWSVLMRGLVGGRGLRGRVGKLGKWGKEVGGDLVGVLRSEISRGSVGEGSVGCKRRGVEVEKLGWFIKWEGG